MIAVAGLGMASGYHDSHVGVTKTIVRRIRALRKPKTPGLTHELQQRPGSTVPTIGTHERHQQRNLVALRAAEVSTRVCLPFLLFTFVNLSSTLFISSAPWDLCVPSLCRSYHASIYYISNRRGCSCPRGGAVHCRVCVRPVTSYHLSSTSKCPIYGDMITDSRVLLV